MPVLDIAVTYISDVKVNNFKIIAFCLRAVGSDNTDQCASPIKSIRLVAHTQHNYAQQLKLQKYANSMLV